MQIQQKIVPFLSFESQAEEAAHHYVSILPNSQILRTVKNPATGAVITVEFELAGLKFVALNTGQQWPFTDAFSLSVHCETQTEIDDLWAKLTAGGKEVQCGWLKDKFGVSWQIVPSALGQLLGGSDPVRSQRVMQTLMQMIKLDLPALQRAYDGKG
jgi:predicted 3-demethylubiquinone-9 3-methyltransferase (glyoxalase superfamily)